MLEYQHILVRCPRDPWQQRVITLQYLRKDSKVIYSPCNGCEYLNGDPACAECLSLINQYILRDISKPVDFSSHPFIQQP